MSEKIQKSITDIISHVSRDIVALDDNERKDFSKIVNTVLRHINRPDLSLRLKYSILGDDVTMYERIQGYRISENLRKCLRKFVSLNYNGRRLVIEAVGVILGPIKIPPPPIKRNTYKQPSKKSKIKLKR